MNFYFALILTTLLTTATTHALAASTVDLTVKGTITPIACTPALSNNGLVDYGKVSRQDLGADIIAPTSELDLSADVQLDGSATLDVVYF